MLRADALVPRKKYKKHTVRVAGPKRPGNARAFFQREVTQNTGDYFKSYNNMDRMAFINEMFNQLESSERLRFERMAQEDRERYYREREDYTGPSHVVKTRAAYGSRVKGQCKRNLKRMPVKDTRKEESVASMPPVWQQQDEEESVASMYRTWQPEQTVAASMPPSWQPEQTIAASMPPSWQSEQTIAASMPPSWQPEQIIAASMPPSWQPEQTIAASMPLSWEPEVMPLTWQPQDIVYI